MSVVTLLPEPSLALLDPAYLADGACTAGRLKAAGFSRTTEPAQQIINRSQFSNSPDPSLALLDPAYLADWVQVA